MVLCNIYMFSFFQFKRHKSKKHTRNFAKSVVNLVDAVSNINYKMPQCCSMIVYFNANTKPMLPIIYCVYIIHILSSIVYYMPYLQIFKEQLNTHVVLVAVEIWTDRDRIPLSVKPLDMLKDFSKYRQQNIGINADAVHLFT